MCSVCCTVLEAPNNLMLRFITSNKIVCQLFFYLLETVERWVYVEYWLPTTASPPLILGGSDLGSASGLQRGFCLTGSTFLRRPSMLQQPRREDMSFRGGTTLL